MEMRPFEFNVTPPLMTLWQSNHALVRAVSGGATIFGMTPSGAVTAVNRENGNVRWQTTQTYLPGNLTLLGSTVFAFKTGTGLVSVQDQGSNYSENILYAMESLDTSAVVSQPVATNTHVHFVLSGRLLGVNRTSGGLEFEVALTGPGPHTLMLVDGDLLVISGLGSPSRWRITSGGYNRLWQGGTGGANTATRPALVVDDRIIVGDSIGVSAYRKSTGTRLWSNPHVGSLALATRGSVLYSAGNQGALWALNLSDGALQWDRKYLAFVSSTSRVGLAVSEHHLWVGALLDDGAEPAALWAVDLASGNFAWQAAGVSLPYGSGLPLAVDDRLFTYGGPGGLTAMRSLPTPPGVTPGHISHAPNPLRGAWTGFNPVEVDIRLGVAATISFRAWREKDVRGNSIGPISYGPGRHTVYYDARFPFGWSDVRQFGRLVFDIVESSGLQYSQSLLVPVNTLPDIHHHWAKDHVETMIYHKFIGGYPDLTFRANNLVTRAESSTIIAKTLRMESPSAGFRTRFSDIGTHWARLYIMALEEKEIINGFQEPDGTFTFRADLRMTRAQNARLLVNAFAIAPAAPGFETNFTDIAGHWAESDIIALESRGYVTGFRESNGTYSFRPEQSLTRGELCTMVVRIRGLRRP